jgi:hypothetical protein
MSTDCFFYPCEINWKLQIPKFLLELTEANSNNDTNERENIIVV